MMDMQPAVTTADLSQLPEAQHKYALQPTDQWRHDTA